AIGHHDHRRTVPRAGSPDGGSLLVPDVHTGGTAFRVVRVPQDRRPRRRRRRPDRPGADPLVRRRAGLGRVVDALDLPAQHLPVRLVPDRPWPAADRPAQLGRDLGDELMSTVLLVRHGLTALTGPVLSGRTAGVHLDERGRAQAESLAQRTATLPLAAVVTSPLERCTETADAIAAAQLESLQPQVDERLIECDYGDWTGRPLKELARDPLWKLVQVQPSAVRFPNGESLPEVAARAVHAVRDWDSRLGGDALWVACSHGDVIKAVLADALGLHLD